MTYIEKVRAALENWSLGLITERELAEQLLNLSLEVLG